MIDVPELFARERPSTPIESNQSNLHETRGDATASAPTSAPLTDLGRLRLARCVVDDGWLHRQAAERFQVSVTTVSRWAGRYRQYGEAG